MISVDLDTGNLAKMLFNKTKKQDQVEKRDYRLLDESRIETSDGETIYNGPIPSNRHRSLLSICLKGLISILALYGTFSALRTAYKTTFPPKRPSCNCGDTIDEAMANNCKYDEYAAAWLPPACRDDELSAEFARSGPNLDGSWTYYVDRNKTMSMTAYDLSQLPLTGGHFFATHEWHVVHCSFYWRKLARSRTLGTVMEKRYDTEMHMKHCEMMFLKRDPLDKIVTEAGVSLHSDVLVVAKPKHKDEHQHPHGHEHHDGMKMDMGMGGREDGY